MTSASDLERVLGAIGEVKTEVALLRRDVEVMLDDIKDHEGRLRLLEDVKADPREMQKLNDDIKVLQISNGRMWGGLKVIMVAVPTVSAIVSGLLMVLVQKIIV